MKFVFYGNSDFQNFLNIPITPLSDNAEGFYRLGRQSCSAAPPVPANIFNGIPKGMQILYDIFSLDCCLNENGELSFECISEEEALRRSVASKIYTDSFSCTAYFRYADMRGQHTVWLEDTCHTIAKIKLLESLGFDTLGIVINDITFSTVINLIHADCGSI